MTKNDFVSDRCSHEKTPIGFKYRDDHEIILDIDDDIWNKYYNRPDQDRFFNYLMSMFERYPNKTEYFDTLNDFLMDDIVYIHGISFGSFVVIGGNYQCIDRLWKKEDGDSE